MIYFTHNEGKLVSLCAITCYKSNHNIKTKQSLAISMLGKIKVGFFLGSVTGFDTAV